MRILSGSKKRLTAATVAAMKHNLEILREGSAVADFGLPTKTTVGATPNDTATSVGPLNAHLRGREIFTELETAEPTKYVNNARHALKSAFGNDGVCSRHGLVLWVPSSGFRVIPRTSVSVAPLHLFYPHGANSINRGPACPTTDVAFLRPPSVPGGYRCQLKRPK